MGCGASRAITEIAVTPSHGNTSTSSAKAAGEVASTPPFAEVAAKAAPPVEPENFVTTNISSQRPEARTNSPIASPNAAAPPRPLPATQGPRPPASHRTQSLPHSTSQPPSALPFQPIRSPQSARALPKLPTSPGPAHTQPAALSPACPTLLTPLAKPRQGSCSSLPPLDLTPAPPPAHDNQPPKTAAVSPHRTSRLSTPIIHQPVAEAVPGDLEEVLGRLPHAFRDFWKEEFGSEDGASTERFCNAVRGIHSRMACHGTVGMGIRIQWLIWVRGRPGRVMTLHLTAGSTSADTVLGYKAWCSADGSYMELPCRVTSSRFAWACQNQAACPCPTGG